MSNRCGVHTTWLVECGRCWTRVTYRRSVNNLMVVPPTGTALPEPSISHIVNASWAVMSRLGYDIGRTIV